MREADLFVEFGVDDDDLMQFLRGPSARIQHFLRRWEQVGVLFHNDGAGLTTRISRQIKGLSWGKTLMGQSVLERLARKPPTIREGDHSSRLSLDLWEKTLGQTPDSLVIHGSRVPSLAQRIFAPISQIAKEVLVIDRYALRPPATGLRDLTRVLRSSDTAPAIRVMAAHSYPYAATSGSSLHLTAADAATAAAQLGVFAQLQAHQPFFDRAHDRFIAFACPHRWTFVLQIGGGVATFAQPGGAVDNEIPPVTISRVDPLQFAERVVKYLEHGRLLRAGGAPH